MQKSNWKEFIFKDLGQIITGKTPSTKEKGVFGCDIPFLTPTDITNQRYISTTNRFLSKTGNFSVKKFLLPKNSISVTCIGSDMGKVVINARELITNQQINSIIINSSIVDYLYLYYALKKRKKELLNLGLSGSTMPILNKTAFSNLKISLPPLEEQKRIAGVLGAFDDKIELLQKQNTTLENMAKALFKSWFVDFDVVHAKQQGQPKAAIMQQYHLTEELYNLFPSSFEPSALGPIPTGWKVKKIGNITKITSGKRPKSTVDVKDTNFIYPVYGGNGIKWWTNSPLYTTPIIITGRVGTLGQVYRIYSPVWISDNALIFEPEQTDFEFLFYFLNRVDFSSLNRGSTQPLITQGDIKNIDLLYSSDIILQFHHITVTYEQKIQNNNKQIQTLTEMRDALLPRLISGKIRV